MQLEAKEPTHARFPPSGISRKDTVLTDSFGVTHYQRSRVDEADTRASSIPALHIGKPRNHHLRYQCYKARVTHQARKFAGEMHLNVLGVIGFERPLVRLVKMNEHGHHLDFDRAGLCALAACLWEARLALHCGAK